MNWSFQQALPENFHPSSRVWIYQSSRSFMTSEIAEIEPLLKDFVQQWKTHGTPVKGYAGLFFDTFLVLMADETATGVSGCSTDSSVRLVKEIEKKFNVDLFNRQNLAFIIKDKIQQIPLSQLEYALENNFISIDTPYFNNTVLSKAELENNWIIPMNTSWLKSRLPAVS